MALIPYLDEREASPEVLAILKARAFVLNINLMTANAQSVFKYRSQMSGALLTRIKLDPRLRELAILRTAKDCKSIYEWTQHIPPAKFVGLTDEKIAAIENWREAGCFSELERLVLQLTDEVNDHVKGSRETIEGLKRYLGAAEIVELLIIIGHWRSTASILETLEVELEEFAGTANILVNRPPLP
jgi:4-carboxymuconolactone decarboxylase